jgi:hypothetical protein
MCPTSRRTTVTLTTPLDDLLAGAEVGLNDEILDKINQIVPPGIDVAPNGAAYNPRAILKAELRRRPTAERAAA